MRFHDAMAMALYDPEHGFYTRGPAIGPGGAFSTSVRFPAFRRAIARLAQAARDAVGSPFRVVELGAGTGELARAVLAEAKVDEYVTVDASPALRVRQAAVPGVRAVASTAELDPAPGLVFGNEVLDALPVRRVVGGAHGELLEVALDVGPQGLLRQRLVPLADAAVAARLAREGVAPARGQVLDVAPALDAFARDAARLVERGHLLFIDYGDPAEALYASSRPNGTLAAYRGAGIQDPLAELGEQDLTADVDWTCVEHAATGAGLASHGLVTQERLLRALGVEDLGMPDEVHMVAGAAGLGSAFQAMAFSRGVAARLPGF